MPDRPKLPRALVIFTMGYIAVASISALVNQNREFVIYIVVMAVLIVAIVAVHRRCNLSRALLWCLTIWGLLHMAGGLVPIPKFWPYNGPNSVLYSLWFIPDRLKYDQVVHAYGFAITTWLCWEALRAGIVGRLGQVPQPTVGLMVLCAAGGMGFGAFNEIVEFAEVGPFIDTPVKRYSSGMHLRLAFSVAARSASNEASILP